MEIFKFPSGPYETNAILIGCSETKKAAVFDPSFGSTESILAQAKKSGLTLEKIFLTHSHWDHIADVSLLKMKTGSSITIHRLDAGNLEHPGSDRVPSLLQIQGIKPDHFVEGGDLIEIGNLRAEVIHCPGHTPGGVAYYFPKEKLLISGDTLFKGTMGRVDLSTGEADQMGPTLRKLGQLPAETRVIPGHGPDTTIGHESWIKNR